MYGKLIPSAQLIILTVMNGHNIFSNGADHFAPIFEYLIKDYNVASGRYAEYYTPGEISRIIAKILTQDDKQKNRTIYDRSSALKKSFVGYPLS